jgi:hypothetical protein
LNGLFDTLPLISLLLGCTEFFQKSNRSPIEAEVAFIKNQLKIAPPMTKPWWEKIVGTFVNNPAYDEAMQLGREYRESQRSHSGESEDI